MILDSAFAFEAVWFCARTFTNNHGLGQFIADKALELLNCTAIGDVSLGIVNIFSHISFVIIVRIKVAN